MDQVFRFPLTYHLPLDPSLSLYIFPKNEQLGKTNPLKNKKDDETYNDRNKRSDPQAIDALLLPPTL